MERCRALAEPIATELGLELFDVRLLREGGRLILRYVIDKIEGIEGITHQDCERFSKLLDPLLDAADPIDSAYFLEVSSPGVERPLRHEADYRRFAGQLASIVVHLDEDANTADAAQSHSGSRTTYEAELGEIVDGSLMLKLKNGEQKRVLLSSIERAKLLLTTTKRK